MKRFAFLAGVLLCNLAFATVSEQTGFVRYDCDGATTGFTFDFKITSSSDLKVLLVDTSATPNTYTTLTESTHYTVSVTNGIYPATGGTVTVTTVYSATYDLIIATDFALTQTLTLDSTWRPVTVTRILDKLTLIANQFARQLNQAPHNPDTLGTTPTTELAGSGASGYVYRSGTGSFSLATPSAVNQAIASPWDEILAGTASIDEEFAIFSYYNVKSYGAEGDGITDDTTAIQNTIDAAEAGGGGVVYMPPGTYKITTAISVPTAVTLCGAGSYATIIEIAADVDGIVIKDSANNGAVCDLQVRVAVSLGASTTQAGLRLGDRVNRFAFERILITESTSGKYKVGNGVEIATSWSCNFSMVTVHTSDNYGLYATAGQGHTFTGCDFGVSSGTAGYIGCAASEFAGCQFQASGTSVAIDVMASGNTIVGSYVEADSVGAGSRACHIGAHDNTILGGRWTVDVAGDFLMIDGSGSRNYVYGQRLVGGGATQGTITDYAQYNRIGGGYWDDTKIVHDDDQYTTIESVRNGTTIWSSGNLNTKLHMGHSTSGMEILTGVQASEEPTTTSIYSTASGSAAPFDEFGNLVLNPRTDANYRSIYFRTGATQYTRVRIDQIGTDFFGNVYITSYASSGSESLTNGALTAGTSWSATADCSLASDAATWTYSAGTESTLTQASATLAVAGVANRGYRFVYTISAKSGLPTAYIKEGFAVENTYLDMDEGTHTLYFRSAASTGDFVISCTPTTGQAFTLDTLSLKPLTDGDLFVGDDLLAFGTGTFEGGAVVKNGSTSGGYLRLYEDSDEAGGNYIDLIAPALAGNITITLPATDGDAGQVLVTDGSGVTSWAAAGGSADDTAYDATSWNNNMDAATKNAIRDKFESLGGGGFDATAMDDLTWSDGVNASNTWTFNVSGADDTTMIFGSAMLTLSHDLTVTGSDVLLGTAGVKLTGDGDGAITLLGLGNGYDEDLTLNLDDTENTGVVSSSTGLATINFSSIALQESGVGVLNADEIDASSELYAIMDDETGSASGSPLLVFNVNPTLTGATLAGILADNDDMVFEADADDNGTNKFSFTNGGSTEVASITEAGVLYTSSNIELGHASDTTLSRVSAGVVAVEGVNISLSTHNHSGTYEPAGITASDISDKNAGTDITADLEEESHASEHAVSGGDTVFPADPGADRYLMWDDDPGALVWAEVAGAAHDAVTLAADAGAILGLSTQELNLDTQTANYVFAGPTSGAAADPTFRALVIADIPTAAVADADTTHVPTCDGVRDYVVGLGYLTAEVDGSTSNELPTAGTAIDVSGTEVSWDSAEVEATTWGAGGNASNIWTFNLSGTDTTLTWGSGLATFSHAVTAGGTITSSGTFDVTGAVGMTLGSADVTGLTITTDGTGNGELTLPAGSIGAADIDWGSGAGQVDLADIPGGVAGASAFDFGGATSLEIPNGTDKDVDAAGELSQDTDAANESGDVSIRAYDGTNQFLVERKLKVIQATIVAPQDMDDTTRDCLPLWSNNTGMQFTITEIRAWSDTDNTTLTVEVVTATDFSSPATVDALEIATNGTSVYTVTETTITDATIEHDEILTLDFDNTDDPGWVKIEITGWYNANID